ncbi:MAG: hypothetical protein NDJ90_14275 [Oligoflexia bacterium]|nr:hypothetical protein [Oligoflexia bacterium]
MRGNFAYISTAFGVIAIGLTFFWGCSTTELRPIAVTSVAPPQYVDVPQPAGFDLSDVSALFVDRRAPAASVVAACDADFRKLRGLTESEDELRKGVDELVKSDPVAYHWCFYGKILDLEKTLKTTPYVDERQKAVLDAYAFLVPLAKGFMREYQDSRYLRWAIRHYRGVSETVFFKKLDQSPRMTAELVEVANPFGLWRDPASSKSVLEKYHLVKPAASPVPAPSVAPSVQPELTAEAAAPAPGPSPEPSPTPSLASGELSPPEASEDESAAERFPATEVDTTSEAATPMEASSAAPVAPSAGAKDGAK